MALVMASCATTKDKEKESNYPYDQPIEKLAGLKIPLGWAPPASQTVEVLRSAVLPKEFDWRDKGLTPIKNQGTCGSCWAFSTTATFQDVVKVTTGKTKDFSEQYLLSCNNEGWSCNGGFFAHDYHMSKGYKGAVDGKRYPYTGRDDSCQHNHSPIDSIVTWKYLQSTDVESIKTAIYAYGPVAAAVYVDDPFVKYRSGVFNQCKNIHPNHAVNIVGWGDGYWIMRNSWSERWGEDGWMKIPWNCSNIGYAANFITYNKRPRPAPTPTPDPTPDPRPDPNPGPGPSPVPDPDPEPDPRKYCTNEAKYRSQPSRQLIPMKIVNRTGRQLRIYWLDYKGNRRHYYTLNPRRVMRTRTYLRHGWVAVGSDGRCRSLYYPINWWERNWVVY